jgi:hypothetical protein
MTVPGDPTSRDPADPFGSGPVGGPPASAPTTAGEAATPTAAALPLTDGSPTPTPTASSTTPSTPAGTGSPPKSGSGGGKVKAAALVAGAAALVHKLRKEAPKKAREVREKRVAGRCILLTEVAGRPVAIGPYRDEQAARQDLTRVTGAPQVLELKSQAYFGTPDSDPSITP